MNPLPDMTQLTLVLAWVIAGGSVSIAGAAFSILASNWDAWNGFPSVIKKALPLFVSIILAVGSTVLLNQAEFLAFLQPWYAIVAQTVLAYLSNQATYFKIVRPVEQARIRGS